MTATESVYEKAIQRRLAAEKTRKIEKTIRRITRAFLSFAIPFAAAFFIALIATFGFHANRGADFSFNLWYFFCKSFFPCLPFMVWFIVKN